jgi:hypothetical protein
MKDESIKRRGLGRLYTIKALVVLGPGWHSSGEIMTWLNPYTHTNYIFEISARWPQLIEVNLSNKEARIRPKAYSIASRSVNEMINEVKPLVGV